LNEERLADKISLDNKCLIIQKTIIKLKQNIEIDDNKTITTLKITLAEYEYLEAKKKFENYLKIVISDTLSHIENMYISTNDILTYQKYGLRDKYFYATIGLHQFG